MQKVTNRDILSAVVRNLKLKNQFGSDGLRGKKAIINILSSSVLQVITLVCGLIVPRVIIGTYGSEINGMMNSIAQFLGYIVLLESGVGVVARSALYKPVADKDGNKISGIVMAAEGFFRKICFTFIAYSVVVACVFPFMVDGDYDWFFTFSLVMIICISTVSQYYFGITYQFLVQADQKRYVTEIAQAATLVLNALVVIISVKLGAGVHIMKLASSLVFALRPIVINIYVRKKYNINRKTVPDKGALSQRWDGLAHHIAFFIHLNTDVVILTIFSKISNAFSIAEVSVYSVYYSIIYGIEKISNILHSAVEAAFGNMLAKGEKKLLKQNFRVYESLSMMMNTFLFTCTGALAVPFVSVYMADVTDADYIRPMFAYVLTMAEAMFCLRKPYNNVTLAAGHFHQTKKGAFVEAGLNVALSIILVIPFGITGVALATLISMSLRTFEYVRYLYKYILEEKLTAFIVRLAVNFLACAATMVTVQLISSEFVKSFGTFFVYAVIVAFICGVFVSVFNLIFFAKDFKFITIKAVSTIKNFKKK